MITCTRCGADVDNALILTPTGPDAADLTGGDFCSGRCLAVWQLDLLGAGPRAGRIVARLTQTTPPRGIQ